jgi:hypothetical protein
MGMNYSTLLQALPSGMIQDAAVAITSMKTECLMLEQTYFIWYLIEVNVFPWPPYSKKRTTAR